MANVTESPIYEAGIYQLETTDPVLGGPSGVANTQAKQLANRTSWLKQKVDLLGYSASGAQLYTGNVNSLVESGWYYIGSAATNKPVGATIGFLQVVRYTTEGYILQVFHSMADDRSWSRRIQDGPVYQPWSEFARAADLLSLNDQLVGMVGTFAMNTAPTNWIKCNGAAISRSTYAKLFEKIGTTFGVGNGTTTFNLPDLRAEFVRGWDDGRGVDPSRVFGSAQAESVNTAGYQLREASATWASAGNALGSSVAYFDNANIPSYGTNMTLFGGTETRPRNIALLYCIKFA